MLKKAYNWARQNKLPLALSVIFLAIGAVLGVGINSRMDFSMHFDEKINAAELLQVFVGVILVWIIANTLEKTKQTERNSKDIVQRRIRELHGVVDQFSDHKFTDKYEYAQATVALKRIETGVESVRRLIKATELTFPTNLLNEVEGAASDLDDLLTNIPVHDSKENAVVELSVDGGICTFGGDRLARIYEAFDTLKNALLELEIHVNLEKAPAAASD